MAKLEVGSLVRNKKSFFYTAKSDETTKSYLYFSQIKATNRMLGIVISEVQKVLQKDSGPLEDEYRVFFPEIKKDFLFARTELELIS